MPLGGHGGAGGVRGLRLPRRRQQDGAPVAGCHCPHGCAEGGRATLLSPRKGVPGDRIMEYLGSEGILKGHRDKG